MSARRPQVPPIRTRSLTAIESVELSTFNDDNDNANSESASSRPAAYPWHPKLTLYRLLILVATVGLGAAKAVTSYLNLNYASITLEWVLGVVIFLFFHLTGSYEERDTRGLNWLFHVDYLEYMWNLLAIFEILRPSYRSDELNGLFQRSRHPMITGYRILVSVLVIFFGILKSAFWYGNRQNDVTTIECVFGVGIVTCLYWLGLYEASSAKKYPFLFHVDYSDKVLYGLSIGAVFGWIIIHLIALSICSGMSVGFYFLSSMFFNFRWSATMFPEFRIVSIMTSIVIESLLMIILLSAVGCSIVILYKLLEMFALSPLGRHIGRLPGPREVISFTYSLYHRLGDHWLPQTVQQRRSRVFYTKRFIIRQIFKLPIIIITTCTILFSIAMLLWMVVMLASGAATFLQALSLSVSVTFPLSCFLFLLPIGWFFAILVPDFYDGFLAFLSGIRNDYNDES